MKPKLTTAAEAVRTALTELERIDGQAAGLREQLEGIDALQVILTGLEDRRAQLLEEALLAGRKAETAEIDKQLGSAQRAIERRRDERTATERALPALASQRAAAEATLVERRAEYEAARAEHIAGCVRKALPVARELAAQFSSAIADVRAAIALMPTSEQTGLDEEVSGLVRDLELFEIRDRHPSWATFRVSCALRALAGPVTSRLQGELEQAREATGLPEEEPAVSTASDPQELGHVWSSDGSVHAEPEPPRSEPVRVIRARREGIVGLVETQQGERSYLPPGLVRSY